MVIRGICRVQGSGAVLRVMFLWSGSCFVEFMRSSLSVHAGMDDCLDCPILNHRLVERLHKFPGVWSLQLFGQAGRTGSPQSARPGSLLKGRLPFSRWVDAFTVFWEAKNILKLELKSLGLSGVWG